MMNQFGNCVKAGRITRKDDLIGAIYHSVLYELMDFEKVYTPGERMAWQEFEETLKRAAEAKEGRRLRIKRKKRKRYQRESASGQMGGTRQGTHLMAKGTRYMAKI